MQFLISFLEGIVTFISPCILPMLPVYVSYFAGGGERKTGKTVTNAVGFVAGFTGNQLIRELKEKGLRSDFISVERGMTRINVKVKGNCETEINGCGPLISPVALQVLMIQMERLKIVNMILQKD